MGGGQKRGIGGKAVSFREKESFSGNKLENTIPVHSRHQLVCQLKQFKTGSFTDFSTCVSSKVPNGPSSIITVI